MGKTLLHRIFGLGKIPKQMLPILEQEGIVLLDEGIGGSITFRNFRAPWKRYGLRRNYFTGSIVLTQKRFAAFQWATPIINVPLENKWLNELHCSLKDEVTLCVLFDPSVFNEDWSGSIEVRFSTPQARKFLELLKEKTT
ncbi:MAG: hypothetical protein AB4426_14460 [Xenococcaceae cyanobacterium]